MLDDETNETANEQADEVESGVNLIDAMKAPNLVPLLKEADVNKIGSEALREFEIDWESCEEFRQRYDRAMDMATQKKKEKTFPWPNASNVIFPLLTQASIQFQARAYPAIIDGTNVVKGKVLGPDPEGIKQERADRVAAHMTWQYLYDVPGWEEDTDKLLLQLPIVGCVFRKSWHDPIYNRNNCETINAKDFVVHYNTVSLDKAPRFTHVQRYYPHEIEAFVRSEIWAKVPYDGDDGSDPHSLVEFLEQYRLIDMDDDGLAEPYIVTLTRDGAVARIVACFDPDGVFITAKALDAPVPMSELAQSNINEAALKSAKVLRIERKEYFTKYSFIPSPDGSFYDIGFGSLTDNLGAAVNTIINQLIDAGTLANMQGGFIAGGTKIKGGNMRFSPGEWKRVEGAGAGALKDNIMPLQLPGPSPVLFQLLGMLVEAVKGITSVSDIITGNQDSQTAPTTALALIEQGQKVFTAIYQRIHRSLGCDIRIMRTLNRDFLDQQQYFALDDNPQAVGKDDYQDKDLDFVPVSDPRAINDQVKMAKAQILMSHNGDPLVNQVEIRRREFEAAGIPDIKALLDVPPPPPDPKLGFDAAKTKMEADRTTADNRNKNAMTAKTLVEAAQAAYVLGTTIGDLDIKADAQRLLDDALGLIDSTSQGMKEVDDGQPTDGPGPVQPMEGQQPDGSVPPVPAGPGEGGGGPVDSGAQPVGGDAGGPDAGGDVGGLGGPGM